MRRMIYTAILAILSCAGAGCDKAARDGSEGSLREKVSGHCHSLLQDLEFARDGYLQTPDPKGFTVSTGKVDSSFALLVVRETIFCSSLRPRIPRIGQLTRRIGILSQDLREILMPRAAGTAPGSPERGAVVEAFRELVTLYGELDAIPMRN